MPTYDGIGSSVTHEIEVVGDVFISNVEGGSLSTQVPFEIFSNVSGMVSPPTDSRQVRLRVQPTTEASPDDSYVTDMGIQNTTDNYFFITAPQNTSNVGDQNTFVISKTSNVGIGTTDPEKPLHVVGDSWITGTLTASNIVGASPVTISSGLVMGSGSTLTTSNIVGSSSLTVTANTNVVAEFTASEKLIKYPRVNMTANSDQSYVASASSDYQSPDYEPWEAFNGVLKNLAYTDSWISTTGTYNTGTGLATTTDSFNGVNGSWLKIQLPTAIKLMNYTIHQRGVGYPYSNPPKKGKLYGSTNGSTWSEIDSFDNLSFTSSDYLKINVNNENYYSYFLIHIEEITVSSGSESYVAIQELELYGYPENDLGDGTSVLFKTVPNTPKTDFLDVYYDAKEYSGSGNITDESGNGVTGTIGSSVSYTSTEPKAWNFDGTVNGTVSASLTTPGGDWPHTLAVWFKADSITTTQSTNTIGWFGTLATRQSSVMKISPTFIGFDFVNDSQDATLNVQTGIWYHAVFVYPGGGVNNAKIYVNGFDAGATGGSTNAISLPTSTTLYLANQTNSFNPYFNGSIANYRLYDRALSADEITELYDYQKAYFQNNNYQINYKNGFVGIGTSEPRAVLDVVGDVNVTDNLIVGTSNLFVDNVTGRVGIGTDSPLRKLDVRSGDAVVATNWISGAFGPELSAGDRVVIGNLYGKACIGAHNSGLTGWADLTINSAGGNVGIGTVSPSYALHVQSSTNPQMLIGNSGGGGNIYFGNGNHGVGRGTGKNYFTGVNDVALYTAGGDCGLSTAYGAYYLKLTNGGVVLHNGSTVHSSDDRIKINEERITNATETLMKLDPQIYDKTIDINSSNVFGREAGLIIQDVWYDAPELRYLVLPADDANPSEEKPQRSDNIQEDPDYSDWGSKSGHFNYTGLIPYLIKSNQEQQALIENLKARIESLENSS